MNTNPVCSEEVWICSIDLLYQLEISAVIDTLSLFNLNIYMCVRLFELMYVVPPYLSISLSLSQYIYIYIYIYTGWNDKIVAREKTTWFHFHLMKTSFLFLLQTIYLLASCVQIPRAIGAFYHVRKWHNVQRARSEMHRCTTHALYRSKLWQKDHCQHPQNANLDCHE